MTLRQGFSEEKQDCGMFKESVRRKANLILLSKISFIFCALSYADF